MSDGRHEKAKALARKIFKYGELGIKAMNEVAKEIQGTPEDVPDERPIVAILIPCYKHFHPRMNTALNMLVDYTRKSGKARVFVPPQVSGSVVHWMRNALLCELIKSGRPYTHVLMIDDDMVPKPDDLVKLLEHKVDIVAGLATRRQDPPIPNARLYDEKVGMYQELWEWPDGLIEVGAVGTGMILMSLNAIQKTADAFFDCVFEKKAYNWSDEKIAEIKENRVKEFNKEPNAWWFKFRTREDGVGEYGEDIYFCHLARLMGLKVHVDTTVQPGHMGDYDFGVKDFLPYRDDKIAEAKAKGKYIAPPSLLQAAKSGIVLVED